MSLENKKHRIQNIKARLEENVSWSEKINAEDRIFESISVDSTIYDVQDELGGAQAGIERCYGEIGAEEIDRAALESCLADAESYIASAESLVSDPEIEVSMDLAEWQAEMEKKARHVGELLDIAEELAMKASRQEEEIRRLKDKLARRDENQLPFYTHED
jgi:chromosome segregation ATPase